MEAIKKRYFGNKEFYRYVLGIAVPMILQNVVTNFVSLLDNIMVGRVGTNEMSGVSIANQYMFIFNITIFGALAGPSIFGTQFYGKGDHEGQKYTLRFRLVIAILITVIAAFVLHTFDEPLLSLYISADDDPAAIAETLKYAKEYLNIMLFGLIPFAFGQVYSSVIRETGETKIQMIGSFSAVGVNLILDYGLIFGKLGMPCLGVKGAAIATVIAKIIEALVVIVWAHVKKEQNKYIIGLFKGFGIPGDLMKTMIKKGTPLLFNEFLWVVGVSAISQSYSIRGLDVVAARNIANTISNLFGVVYIQLGCVISIIVGQQLGAGKLEEAKETDTKLIVFSVLASSVVGVLMIPLAYIFPNVYNTEIAVRELASYIIIIQALCMPLWALTNAYYFTLRSGGRTGITFLFDFVFTWALQIPLSFFLAYGTDMNFRLLFAIVTFAEVVKAIAGHFMVKSGIWVQNLVDK